MLLLREGRKECSEVGFGDGSDFRGIEVVKGWDWLRVARKDQLWNGYDGAWERAYE